MAVGSTRRERGHWRCATPVRSLLTDAPQRDREGTFEETATSFCFEGHFKGNRERLEAPALLLRGTSGATESDRTATQSPASLCSRGASPVAFSCHAMCRSPAGPSDLDARPRAPHRFWDALALASDRPPTQPPFFFEAVAPRKLVSQLREGTLRYRPAPRLVG